MWRLFALTAAVLSVAHAVPVDIPIAPAGLDVPATLAPASAAPGASAATAKSADEVKAAFEAYKAAFGKAYASAEAEAEALGHFAENDAIIDAHNAKRLSYSLGHNAYSDLSWEGFQQKHLTGLAPREGPRTERVRVRLGAAPAAEADDGLPDAVDWEQKGCVTPVKNQGACGSCWAFSAIGSVEGAYCVATGKLVSLSEQELVSCDNAEYGCGGGLMDKAFEFIAANGICTEADDPYASGGGHSPTCHQDDPTGACAPAVVIQAYKDVPPRDEDALKAAVAKQPVSVAIEADRSAFQLYKSGVFTSLSCGTQLDHGVLVVGYGTDGDAPPTGEGSGLPYWRVKNSWGPTWGEAGYIRIQRGDDECGIALQASYPVGAADAPPSPGPGPTPPPPPPPPAPKTHYGDPKTGCLASELAVEVQGAPGDFCSSKCVPLFKPCPRDKPKGVMAMPMCALKDQAHGVSYCALVCAKLGEPIDDDANSMCGPKMSCQPLQAGIGICTYPE